MYILGDTHGLKPIFQIIDKNKLENCNICHVGDFGLGFQPILRDIHNLQLLNEMLIENNIHLYAIRGNHDFKIFWDKSMGLQLPVFHNLHLVEDYEILNIEGKNIFFCGGAISIDRIPRQKDIPCSWDKNEEFILDEYKLNNILLKLNYHIDIIITHTPPHYCEPIGYNNPIVDYYHDLELKEGNNLKKELQMERHKVTTLYQMIRNSNKLSYGFYGHMHKHYFLEEHGIKHIGLGINELYKI